MSAVFHHCWDAEMRNNRFVVRY